MSETARHFEAEPGLKITLHDHEGQEETIAFGDDGHVATSNPLWLGVLETYERVGLVKPATKRPKAKG